MARGMPTIAGMILATSALAGSALATGTPAVTDTTERRMQRGSEVLRSLNKGATQPNLERMRAEFPFLAQATEGYALGDVWSRDGLDPRIRQIAAVAVFAAMGEFAFMKIHAQYALNIGVAEEELKEAIYLVTVPAGFPRAITASQALSEIFAQQRAATAQEFRGTKP
ncbi:carboxymuconolactone decarboxylase family protein 3 [Achromobacter xylosoxidans A8]|uniref:Carboxymuconolactone decarboxylase family protein 3 n=1 Tax=Achromobacter xylosoxidans (strain A8) TaxID=762376 RepID=E3HMC7_ACHXA|nr:carboxymuconolactone decarboxylase family protein [Achromobacter xylosoxidans]ADP17005.1 carboxymuconolactone decarboxylase family protein 3 [Achromobacter xylosoxidans A8]